MCQVAENLSHTGSYLLEQEHRDLESELQRLRAQALLSWRQEARLLGWLGLRDGMTVLEMGSGPGFVTGQLRVLLPHSPIIALDSDRTMLDRADSLLRDYDKVSLQFVHAAAEITGLPSNSCEFVIARYLFQHLPDPAAVAKEALRVLKPGGKLAVIDVDARLWGIVEPVFPQLEALYARSGAEQAAKGGNRLIGRHLWSIIDSAGFQQVELDAFVYHSDSLGIEPFLPQIEPDRLMPLFKSGRLSLHEWALAQTLFRQFRTSSEAYVMMMGLIASGTCVKE